MENISAKIIRAGIGLLLFVSVALAQQGTFYLWAPQNSLANWGSGVSWNPYGMPDSMDTAQIRNGQHTGGTTVVVEDSFVVRILVFDSGRIEGLSLKVLDSLRWFGGELGGNFTMRIPDTGFGKIQAEGNDINLRDSSKVINEGVFYWYHGNVDFDGSGHPEFRNRNRFHIEPVRGENLTFWSNFVNEKGGGVTKTLPAAVRFKNFFNSFYNYGHIDIQDGLFDISTPGVVSGTITVSDPGELYLSSTNQITLSGVDINGNGRVTIGPTINSAQLTLSGDNYVNKVYLEGSLLAGNGSLTVRDSMICVAKTSVNNRFVRIGPGAVLKLDNELSTSLDTLLLPGRTVFGEKGQLGGSSTGLIVNSGIMDIEATGSVYAFSFTPLRHDSAGVINISVPVSEAVTFSPASFTSYGTVNVFSGVMDIRPSMNVDGGIWTVSAKAAIEAGSIRWRAGTELHVSGSISKVRGSYSAPFELLGTMLPGGEAIGKMTLIPNKKVVFGPTTRLIMQLGGTTPGTEYDQVQTSKGTLTMDGTLEVRLYNDFAPAPGDTFDIIKFNQGATGTFSDILLPVLPDSGLSLVVVETDTSLRLAVAGTPTGLAGEEGRATPGRFFLAQNHPNPFNPRTVIRYGLPSAARVRVEVYNMLGQRVALLVNERQTAGVHTVRWGARNNPSGVYVYRIQAGGYVQSRKMILMR